MNIAQVFSTYDPDQITIASLGGHSALDVCHGAKKQGFKTLVVAKKGREKTYSQYYRSQPDHPLAPRGCIDEILLVDEFSDVLNPEIQEQLRAHNAIFIHNRYFWVYFDDFSKVEKAFKVPIYGNRELVKLEERDHPMNQYVLLEKAGIRIPKIIRPGDSGMDETAVRKALDEHFMNGQNEKGKGTEGEPGGPLLVKVNEAIRRYERAFFVVTGTEHYFEESQKRLDSGQILKADLDNAVIEEFVLGAPVNFNYFYSNLNEELELMGTDMRRQTSLDGFLRLDAETQRQLIAGGYQPSMVETGHVACTTKESLLEKAFVAGERFIETLQKEVSPGMIGPFALQGAIASYKGREELVVFDVSMRIPGSPGTRFTPLSGYLYGDSISYGERIAIEIRQAIRANRLAEILT